MKQDAPEQKTRPRRRRRRRQKPAEDNQPIKKKPQKPKEIKAGRLREHVKAGHFTPRQVLDWINNQPEEYSVKFVDWLRRKAKEQ
jgi:hypothetical protein